MRLRPVLLYCAVIHVHTYMYMLLMEACMCQCCQQPDLVHALYCTQSAGASPVGFKATPGRGGGGHISRLLHPFSLVFRTLKIKFFKLGLEGITPLP